MRYMFMRFPGGRAKALTLSYDDGVTQDMRFSDIITRYGIKCTFNLNGKDCHSKEGIGKEEIEKYILARGHEVAVHGSYHRAPGHTRTVEGIRDVLECRLELERELGIIIRGMAYPDTGITSFVTGTDYEGIRNYLRELDITYARTLSGDNDSFSMPSDWYAWMPTAHHDNPEIFEYIEKFVNLDVSAIYCSRRLPRLFYMWGHSYEFDLKNNWEHLERVCEAFSGRDDIWYATNGEIREYTRAYESLVFSADSNIIYNPTLYEIFFTVDGKDYSIKSGETLRLS